ncbi:Neprilysin-1 [Halotydeus destructor]|nr:Neprilysin-1 [Halotydeus destructor]
MKRNGIPDDRTWWSPWSMARVSLKKQVKSLLESSYNPKSHPVPSIRQALSLYKGCLDQDTREEVGLAPLKQILAKIGGWPMVSRNWSSDNYSWSNVVTYLRSRFGLNYLVSFYVDVDSKDTSRRIIYFDRPGLGIGGSELRNPRDPENQKLIVAYRNYIRTSAKLLNDNGVSKSRIQDDITDMLLFEARLARGVQGEDRRDHFGLYNKMTLKQLRQRYPSLRLDSMLKRIFKYARVTLTDNDQVVMQDDFYYKNLPTILRNTSKRTIANYIGWRYVLGYSDYTTKSFISAYFDHQKVAYGQRKPETPWETCYTLVDQYFPNAVGRLYIDNYFSTQSKTAVEKLIKEVKGAFSNELDRYDWMDSYTRGKSKEKLDEMIANVAYQSWILNNTELERSHRGMRQVTPDKFYSAIANLDRWDTVTDLRKLKKAVNRKNSKLSGPATVNAFNYFDLNFIQFPAGVLQSPFFNFGGPAAINFGAIGKTIGHEIIHGFDDEGKQYDKFGNLRDWWTSRTESEYNDRAECFINQYENFREPTTGLYVNGVDTQGENIADNGGVRMAYKAYRNYVKKYGLQSDPLLPGTMSRFTSDQLFFLSFASIWCENERRESMRNTVKYGSHSPSRFRVIGTLVNSKDFSKAFQCPAGSPMNPRGKCVLW